MPLGNLEQLVESPNFHTAKNFNMLVWPCGRFIILFFPSPVINVPYIIRNVFLPKIHLAVFWRPCQVLSELCKKCDY